MAWFLPIAAAVVGGLASSNANKKQNKANQKAQAAQNSENERIQALQNAENERVRLAQNAENRRAAEAERAAAVADFDKQRKLAEQDDADKAVRLRESAEKGGFNPLTLLAAGGLQGSLSPFMSMPSGVSADGFTPAGFTAKGFTPNQVFDWGGTVVNALNAAIPEISGQAGVARQREQLEQDLLRAQAYSLRMPPIGSGGYGASGGGAVASGSPAGLQHGAGDADAAPYTATEGLHGPRPPRLPASSWEEEYGEIGGLFGGIGNFISDGLYRFGDGLSQLRSSWGAAQVEPVSNVTVHRPSMTVFSPSDFSKPHAPYSTYTGRAQ